MPRVDNFQLISENNHMIKQSFWHAGVCTLEPVQAVFRQCVFREHESNYDGCIRQTFQFLREWVVCMGLNPAELLHIGIPVLEDDRLAMYTCCMEYPLLFLDEDSQVSLGVLPGGRYAVLRMEKTPNIIRTSIQQFNNVYIPENGLVRDEHRPVYEIYHEQTMEYCIPILN